jgi:hypothetical protein
MVVKARKPSCGAALRVLRPVGIDRADSVAIDDANVPTTSLRELQKAPPNAPMAGERPKIFFSVSPPSGRSRSNSGVRRHPPRRSSRSLPTLAAESSRRHRMRRSSILRRDREGDSRILRASTQARSTHRSRRGIRNAGPTRTTSSASRERCSAGRAECDDLLMRRECGAHADRRMPVRVRARSRAVGRVAPYSGRIASRFGGHHAPHAPCTCRRCADHSDGCRVGLGRCDAPTVRPQRPDAAGLGTRPPGTKKGALFARPSSTHARRGPLNQCSSLSISSA